MLEIFNFKYAGNYSRTAHLFRVLCFSDTVALLAIFWINNFLMTIFAALIQPATGPSVYNANTDLVITTVGLEDDNTEYECSVQNSNIISSIVLNVTGN